MNKTLKRLINLINLNINSGTSGQHTSLFKRTKFISRKMQSISALIGNPKTLETDQEGGLFIRTCDKDSSEPVTGKLTGEIPKWIKGSLLRNGPGRFTIGGNTLNHLFDGMALLHRFNIENGNITYQCKFLESEAYKASMATDKLQFGEFGTAPKKSLFERLSKFFSPLSTLTDNAAVSIYPFDTDFYALTESPLVHQFDPHTLDDIRMVNLGKKLKIATQTAHPHVESDGTTYNIGLMTSDSIKYGIMCFPGGSMDEAKIVATLTPQWKLNPSYMHSFGITENYFIIIEQPFVISMLNLMASTITNSSFLSSLKWYPYENVKFSVIDRKSGELKHVFYTEPFFFFHTINQYEIDDHIVFDISCYKDAGLVDSLRTQNLKDYKNKPEFLKNFRTRPLRFVFPLKYEKQEEEPKGWFSKVFGSASETFSDQNLITLRGSTASAYVSSKNQIFCTPELLCDVGCEFGRFNYEKYLGRKYRYFYASCTDTEVDNKVSLVKVDADNKTVSTWYEKNAFASEPIFVAAPDAKDEDDGVVLSAVTWHNEEGNRVTLVVLNAKDMKELARSDFIMPAAVPVTFHGWFAE